MLLERRTVRRLTASGVCMSVRYGGLAGVARTAPAATNPGTEPTVDEP